MAVFSRRVPHVANIATASHRFHFLGEDETGCLLAFLRLKPRVSIFWPLQGTTASMAERRICLLSFPPSESHKSDILSFVSED